MERVFFWKKKEKKEKKNRKKGKKEAGLLLYSNNSLHGNNARIYALTIIYGNLSMIRTLSCLCNKSSYSSWVTLYTEHEIRDICLPPGFHCIPCPMYLQIWWLCHDARDYINAHIRLDWPMRQKKIAIGSEKERKEERLKSTRLVGYHEHMGELCYPYWNNNKVLGFLI